MDISYDYGLTVGLSPQVHAKLTKYRKEVEIESLNKNNNLLFSLVSRIEQRKELTVQAINKMFEKQTSEQLKMDRDSLIEAYSKAYDLYREQVGREIKNCKQSPFESLTVFKANNAYLSKA